MKALSLIFLILLFTASCSNQKLEQVSYLQDTITNQTKTKPEEYLSKATPPTSKAATTSTSFLVERTILDKIKVLVPRDFNLMDDEMIELKYPSKKGSAFMAYTDEEATVNIAFEHTPNKAMVKDLPAIKQALEGQFNQPGIDFQKSEIRKINGGDFIIIEMVTPAMDTPVYNLMFITSLEDRLLIGTFNCTIDKLQQWEPTAYQVLNSVTIKD